MDQRPIRSRYRSSTSASNSPTAYVPTDALTVVIQRLARWDTDYTATAILKTRDDLIRVNALIDDDKVDHDVQDQFRRGRGFQVIIHVLQSAVKADSSFDASLNGVLSRIFVAALSIISKMLIDHHGNSRYFARRIRGGGWKILQQTLKQVLLRLGHGELGGQGQQDAMDIVAALFAVAVNGRVEERSEALAAIAQARTASQQGDGAADLPQPEDLLNRIKHCIQDASRDGDRVCNEEAVESLAQVYHDFAMQQTSGLETETLRLTILTMLRQLCDKSERDCISVHNAGVLSSLLPCVAVTKSSQEAHLLQGLCEPLLAFGTSSLEEAAVLFRQAAESDTAKTTLLMALQSSKDPPNIQFDLSTSGHCSIELPCLPKPFPPVSGYSFIAWIRIDQFDPSCHTTLFGAFDTSQKCFVLVYLERDTHQLILQTSVTSSKPSVRFKKMRFKESEWYHVALIHRPAKTFNTSQASLYINGRLVDELQCTYPEPPPMVPELREDVPAPQAITTRRLPVQAFFGTPQDLAPQALQQRLESRWSLANAHLYDTCLSLDLIIVQQKLGPRYCGNFQDCVGPFLTYRASADLNRYNEIVHGDKAEKSDILKATQQRGSDMLPESKLLISASAIAVADMNGLLGNTLNISPLLTDRASHHFQSLARNGNSILFNAAKPAINEALTKQYGIGVVTGQPIFRIAQSLDDASWQLGGCLPIMLRIFHGASTEDAIVSALEIVFECIKDNWRTSEAMEKENGFGVLALLLREKMGMSNSGHSSSVFVRNNAFAKDPQRREALAVRLLKVVLAFVGYDSTNPERSLLINPMAYRVLLVDFDTWRTVSVQSQKLFFRQLADFVWKNNNQAFNIKRFNKMRIVRKMLEAMKIDRVTKDALPDILHALRALCLCKTSHLDQRGMATFITYALQDERAMRSTASSINKVSRGLSVRARSSSSLTPEGTSTSDGRAANPPLSQTTIGIAVLQMYSGAVSAWESTALIRKFDHQVPTTWLLHMAAEPDSRAVAASLTIICRALRDLPSFKAKFADKHAGFITLQRRLRSQWTSPEVWMGCFAILFGQTFVVLEEPMEELTIFHLMEVFAQHGQLEVRNPEIFPAIAGMLEAGIRSLIANEQEVESSHDKEGKIPKTIIQFLADVHSRSQSFRDFAITSLYIKELLFVLFPVIASADRMSAAAELASDGPLTFHGRDVVLRPHSNSLGERPAVLRSGSSRTLPEQNRLKPVQAPRRTSSFVLINPNESTEQVVPARFSAVMSPNKSTKVKLNVGNSAIESLLELIIGVFIDQVCQRKDFSGFGLFLKVPPGFQEHQAYFESYVLLHTTYQLWNYLQLNQKLLLEPKVLTNLARYTLHQAEAVFEGWFIDGAQPLLDFIGKVLDYLQQPTIASVKAVRLCSQAINTMRSVFLRVTLLRLSDLDETESDTETLRFLEGLTYWQTILFSPENQELPFIRLVCYLLYVKLVSPSQKVRFAAASLWRMLLVQKPTEAATILIQNTETSQRHLSTGLIKLAAHDDEELLEWIDQHRKALDDFFAETLAIKWEEFVSTENQKTEESAKSRLAKRKDKLKKWQMNDAETDNVMHRFDISTRHWRSNIHSQERLKHQGVVQDQQENLAHLHTVVMRLENLLRQPSGLFPDDGPARWQLDQTEGRNRMRMRIVPDMKRTSETYQSKRKASERLLHSRGQPDTPIILKTSDGTSSNVPLTDSDKPSLSPNGDQSRSRSNSAMTSSLLEGDFEMVEDPQEDEEGYEDKNRKVLKSLQRGDRVQNICNVSRVVGLEAFEGLLIIGKKCLYLQDAMFQRSDGEIVSVSQAPMEERDPYTQMISGKELSTNMVQTRVEREPARHWNWRELLSMSKRRFLFRDVALEVFFNDGRSYLLTFMSPAIRNEVYVSLAGKAPHVHGSLSSLPAEDIWRLETLRNPDETPSTIGSKFANVFNSAHSNAATRRWMRGEISNFQYLMLVNTMAGRTFNDLTQYPVFPWVLADYTSEELDLTDPRSFRDLSKPMGSQNPAREAEFRDRYQAYAEMGDQNSPPFHYGTHYSTAMIVSSYMIRLPPFVQSYLLLQGGSFDHADRLFDSIEKAWLSASRDNMTDVRELTPEFFYLPEFLLNINGYEFGQKQVTNETINDVVLPPWAKGDPHIFIAKHREALESPYVSEHLQEWIDLIFGYKQRGEAALEATNVFNHLSYQGAKDLDTIQDSMERLATIGIIHNFGQTPYQIFNRAHPRKDDEKHRVARLDTIAESLIKLPGTCYESDERVVALTYSALQERLLASPPCKLNLPPNYKSYVQWGFSDNSVRFFSSDSKRMLGLYECTHIGPISTLLFADSRTLLTGGADSTIGVWTINATSDAVEMQPKTYLFGHRTAISVLAASRAFSTLLSASIDGHVLLWDLNRFDCVRVLQRPDPTRPISCARISNLTGHMALCSGPNIRILTLNGHVLVDQRVCDTDDEEVTCVAFYDGDKNEWVERTLLFTGHRRGIVNVWALVSLRDGAWSLQLVKRLMHVDTTTGTPTRAGEDNSDAAAAAAAANRWIPAVTAVLPLAQQVYTGDEEGKVCEWNCIQKEKGGFHGWR